MTVLYTLEIRRYSANAKLSYELGHVKLDGKLYEIAVKGTTCDGSVPPWMHKLVETMNDDSCPGFPLEFLERKFVDTRKLGRHYHEFCMRKWNFVFGEYTPKINKPGFKIGLDNTTMKEYLREYTDPSALDK